MNSIRRIQVGEGVLYQGIRLRALQEAPQAFKTTYETALERTPVSWSEQADAAASGPDKCTFLAFSDKLPIGIASLYPVNLERPECGELLQVWVDPDYRRTGLGIQLLGAIIQWAQDHDFTDLIATIHVENIEVISFYEKLGFYLDVEASAKLPPRDLEMRRVLL